ncbi:hypothetical protein GBAR_LOCUS478, partial [Geodia barretti]
MFDGGGVPIDHYIIKVDNGTQLETPGPTYSFDIMYNTTLSVNISAHNCAGYSDFFPLEIQYDEGSTNRNREQEKCDVVENSAYGVHVQGSAGDRLEPDYNMENNPLYEMRILSNERHSHKTQTPTPVPVYETV